jgi:hypothetical protein
MDEPRPPKPFERESGLQFHPLLQPCEGHASKIRKEIWGDPDLHEALMTSGSNTLSIASDTSRFLLLHPSR